MLFGSSASARKLIPDSPTIGTATDVGTSRPYNNGAATVTFAAPSFDGKMPITSYTVTSSPGGYTGTGSSSPIIVSGLQSSTQYSFTVTATNAIGTSLPSSSSNLVTATTVPQAPTIGSATAGNGSATVAYTANATGGKTVTQYRATSTSGVFSGTGASPITVSGLLNGTSYAFTVRATNANGPSLESAASNSVTPVAPFAATGGTIVTSGGYKYHTFKANGTFSISSGTKNIEVMAIAGGGSGGTGSSTWGLSHVSGAGAGGVVYTSGSYGSGTSWAITVGGGAPGSSKFSSAGNTGTNTTVATLGLTANGGGAGLGLSGSGIQGGSGGGGATTSPQQVSGVGGNSIPGSGMTIGYGNIGGSNSGFPAACGGGGAGAAGTNATASNQATSGGSGTSVVSTWATATSTGVGGFYAGGGGAARSNGNINPATAYGSGGAGGGTAGSGITSHATANTGSGSGGTAAASGNQYSGNGGSGLVIVRYLA